MPRKGENIYKRKDGRWEGRYRLPDTGRNPYRSIYGKTYHEVKEKLILKKQELVFKDQKKMRLPSKLTIGEAAGLWLEENSVKWKDSTYATYRSITEKHIIGALDRMPAAAFTQDAYRDFFVRLEGMERVGKRPGEKFSHSYLHQIHIIFSQIFRFLDRKYHCGIPAYPCPSAGGVPRVTVTPQTMDLRRLEKRLIDQAGKQDATSLGILLSGCCGLRIGELCALQWGDINLEQGTLRVTKTMQRIRTFQKGRTGTKVIISEPKSRTSNRVIPLPGYLLSFLKGMEGDRKGFLLQGKKKEYLEPRTLQYRFQRILKELQIPCFNFHVLRHIFATNCIASGFDMKTLSELLGHANVATTMKIYVHSDMERKKQLMAGYRMAS